MGYTFSRDLEFENETIELPFEDAILNRTRWVVNCQDYFFFDFLERLDPSNQTEVFRLLVKVA